MRGDASRAAPEPAAPASRRSRPPVGARPGTLVIPAGSPAPRMRAVLYDAEAAEERDVAVDEIPALLERGGGVAWIDVQGLGDEASLRRLAEIFRIHPLALEDVVTAAQRPKAEPYEEHQFILTRMVRQSEGSHVREQVALFLGANYVLSFQERYGDLFDPVRERIRQGKGPMRRSGPDYLVYALLDAIIDGYFPVLERLGEELERLEEEAIEAASRKTLLAVNAVRRDLLGLRRNIWPQRESLAALMREETELVTKNVRIYLRDCYDHTVQIADMLETYRELASGLLNTYLSAVANRTNDVMKILTIMASIFIPLTFLAGIYGMNFEHMPELGFPWAYPVLLALMVAISVVMVVYFVRKGWLGGGGGER